MNANAQTIPVLIRFPGEWFLFDIDIEISLDGESLGKFSIMKGFNINKYILPGKHTISTTVPIRGTKEFPFELNKNEPTVLNLSYSRTWGDFGGLEVSEAKMRLANLYEKKWPKLKLSIFIAIGIICIVLTLYCAYWWDMGSVYTSNCGYHINAEACREIVNGESGKDFTLEEIENMRDGFYWYERTLLFLFFTILSFAWAGITKQKMNTIDEEIEKLELDNYNRGKKKAESERRRNADKAESERIWYAQEAERKEKINLAQNLWDKGGLENLLKALSIYSEYQYDVKKIEGDIAKEKEKHLDYDGAITDFERLGLHKSARRVRRKKMDDMKTEQTIIHGDYVDDRDTTYVDDRDTIVKDSVINRSNVGGGSSKMQELEKLSEMKDRGIIDDDEFKQMKKEILGK